MATLLYINTPLGEGKALITQLSGREQLGQLPEYHFSFLTDKPNVSANDLLGRDITIGLDLDDSDTSVNFRYFNGYITALSDTGSVVGDYFGKDSRAYSYEAVMRPWLYFLTRRANCRIFQDMTVPDIIKKIFKEYSFAEFKPNLNATYRKWEYCCQYRETDFNFISRLMEQEGIYFWFTHEDGKHVLQLGDGPSSHSPAPGFANVIFDDSTGGTREEDRMTVWHSSLRVQPGVFATYDYNFKTPKADMASKTKKPSGHALDGYEIFDGGEEYTDKSEGDHYSKVRAEELASRHQVYDGETSIRVLTAGSTFKLEGHPRKDFDKEYLIVTSSFSATNGDQRVAGGSQDAADFHASVSCIDGRVYYRSARGTPKPTVAGPQPAVIVGPSGDEIHTDEFGRVKVQFFWDRYSEANENSSCWVRVSQPIAGKEWGAVFLPRIGHEVMVEFFEGDPDRPVITGRLYNADNRPPWALPDNKTRSGFRTRTDQGGTSNYNELRFEDKKGEEEIYVRAEKDKRIEIKHDRYESIGNESHLIIEKNLYEQFKSEYHQKVTADHNVDVGDSYSLHVSQDWHGKSGNLIALEGGQEIHLKGGMKVVIEAGTQLSLKVGGNFITIDPSGVSISGTMVNVNSGGSAASGSGAKPDAPKDPKKGENQGGDKSEVKKPEKPEVYSPQAQALKLAHKTGSPFCEQCAAAAAASQSSPAASAAPAP